jgi:type I restriction enzyme S subunit
MKYQTYPAYQDSGVEWLGEVPEHWNLKRLKHNFRLLTEKTNRRENPIALENIESWSGRFIQTETIFEGEGVSFDKGDILFGKLRPYLAKAYLVENSGEAVGDFYVMRPTRETLSKFFQYQILTREFIAIVDSSTFGAKMPRVSWDFFGNMSLATPPLSEQQKIAQFLDHETAKIDTLIEKQRRLIELLKEKRQAVISHAVTKGLNPHAPMKDSGVTWLGEVPEGWEVVPLKYLCNFSGGGTPSKDNLDYWTDGDIPWVSPKDMKSFWLSDTQDKVTERAVKESSTNFVEIGALLMVVRSGILQRTIPIAINTVRVTLNQDMKALRFNEKMNVEYAANFILGCQNSLLLEWSKEGATVESIEHEYLSNGLFLVPSVKEQKDIIEYVKKRMDVFQNLEERAVSAISLLQERRTALISAAVTGKIDVRNWKQNEGEK